MTMRNVLAIGLLCCIGIQPSVASELDKKAKYIGGTTDLKENTKGHFEVADGSEAKFMTKKGVTLLAMPYEKITGLEYGQKAGRRVGLAIAVNPLFLFSKKRKHFLTIYYSDSEGDSQAVVIELSKKATYRVALALQSRSGTEIDFESEDARKHFEKEAKK